MVKVSSGQAFDSQLFRSLFRYFLSFRYELVMQTVNYLGGFTINEVVS